ncbi:MAG: RNA polymerase sigma factor [Gammaproteobacteria bacterium]
MRPSGPLAHLMSQMKQGSGYPKAEPEWLDGARRGDMRAHARLYETFAPMVYTLARRMLVSPTLAEDALQETFVEVIRSIGTWRGDGEFGLWLRRIAINKCLMHLRSSWVSRRGEYEDEPEALPASTDDQLLLERALAALPDTARVVVLLHDVEGYTHQEIARLMGRTASFSKSQLARAHDRLRALLADESKETTLCEPALKTC